MKSPGTFRSLLSLALAMACPLVLGTSGSVLCIGADGHVAIESAQVPGELCCPQQFQDAESAMGAGHAQGCCADFQLTDGSVRGAWASHDDGQMVRVLVQPGLLAMTPVGATAASDRQFRLQPRGLRVDREWAASLASVVILI